MKNLLLYFVIGFTAILQAQTINPTLQPKKAPSLPTLPSPTQPKQTGTPEDVVKVFFKMMADADTIGMQSLFTDKALLQSSNYVSATSSKITSSSITDFIQSIKKFRPGQLDERISNIQSTVLPNIASISMNYSFYLDGKFSHSGVNLFTFLNDGSQWKISSISDTRMKTGQEDNQKIKNQVNELLDNWHLAAARADVKSYFDMLHDESIYIGTDATEVWTKQAFYSFAKPYFDKGKAWDFVKKSRNVYSDSVSKVIWFDEVLDTWMGPCRGSGFVVPDNNGQYKIMQYVLSFIVPNDKADQVIKTMGLPVRKK